MSDWDFVLVLLALVNLMHLIEAALLGCRWAVASAVVIAVTLGWLMDWKSLLSGVLA